MNRPRLIDFKYGENVYNRGNFEEGYYNYYEAFALCQYYIWHLGYGFQKCKNSLIEFSKKSDNNFNEIPSLLQIKKLIRKAMKKEPDNFPKITITQKEIENIQTIKNFIYQKFLFSLLCFAKREKFDTTKKVKKKDFLGYHLHFKTVHRICLDMGLRISERNLTNWLGIFHDQNIIGESAGGSGDNRYISVLYSEDNSTPIVELESLDIPYKKYVEFCGGEKIYCVNCEKCVDKNFRNQKYCEECRMIKRREVERNKKRKQRNKNVHL